MIAINHMVDNVAIVPILIICQTKTLSLELLISIGYFMIVLYYGAN